LSPAFVGENGYRYYDDDSPVRLQEILLFRELEFPLQKLNDYKRNHGQPKLLTATKP